MKIKQITNLWFGYIATMKKHNAAKEIESDDEIAILYGSDQYKINWKTKKIRLAGMSLPCDDLDAKMPTPDWLAIKTDSEGKFSIIFGSGSPFHLDYHNEDNALFKDGMILAMPSIVEAHA